MAYEIGSGSANNALAELISEATIVPTSTSQSLAVRPLATTINGIRHRQYVTSGGYSSVVQPCSFHKLLYRKTHRKGYYALVMNSAFTTLRHAESINSSRLPANYKTALRHAGKMIIKMNRVRLFFFCASITTSLYFILPYSAISRLSSNAREQPAR